MWNKHLPIMMDLKDNSQESNFCPYVSNLDHYLSLDDKISSILCYIIHLFVPISTKYLSTFLGSLSQRYLQSSPANCRGHSYRDENSPGPQITDYSFKAGSSTKAEILKVYYPWSLKDFKLTETSSKLHLSYNCVVKGMKTFYFVTLQVWDNTRGELSLWTEFPKFRI